MNDQHSDTPSPQPHVIVIGAGPVGLLLANLLGLRGAAVTVLEKNPALAGTTSRAIGITPPSLEILEGAGLVDHFLSEGLQIGAAHVMYTPGGHTLGSLTFDRIHDRYPFILSIPQHRTRTILEEGTRRFPSVTVRYEHRAEEYHERPDKGRTDEGRFDANSPTVTVRCTDGSTWSGDYCVAADGAHGETSARAGITHNRGSYRHRFFMADFRDHTDLGSAAYLWFTRHGAVESFPLPSGVRRWIVQLDRQAPGESNGTAPDLEGIVRQRAGYDLDRGERLWESGFQPSWSEAETFHRGKLYLAGDAAHTMSPIGGQGMNVGFGDAALLAELFTGDHHDADSAVHSRYHRVRRRAARSATRRAAAGMTLGTMRGYPASAVRNVLVRIALLRIFRPWIARHFAMLAFKAGEPG